MENTTTTRLRRSTRDHDAYTIRVAGRRVAAIATAHTGDARRWIYTTRWLHGSILRSAGRGSSPLVVGLGVQWTPYQQEQPPRPATLQLCVGHRCLVFHLSQADAVPAVLHRFLADPRVLFVGYGNAYDRRILWEHYRMDVASGCELRAVAGMGNASMERMAERFLGYPGITKPEWVAMSAWHAPRLSAEQVEYACFDAHIAFRLGLILCSGDRAPPPAGSDMDTDHGSESDLSMSRSSTSYATDEAMMTTAASPRMQATVSTSVSLSTQTCVRTYH